MGEIRSVGIMGTGIMARGIAEFLVGKGVAIVLIGRSVSSCDAAREAVLAALQNALKRKRISPEEATAAENLLVTSTDFSALSSLPLLIEAVVEDLGVKQNVFERLAEAANREAILASNTSALPIAEIVRTLPPQCRARSVGLHFMNPAPTVNLVELVRTEWTEEPVLAAMRDFLAGLKRQFVEVHDGPGFIVNRLLMPFLNEAARLVEAGVASPRDIDKAVKLALGHPMGPLALADFIGLDTVAREVAELVPVTGIRPSAALTERVERSELGRKSGQGFYPYGKR